MLGCKATFTPSLWAEDFNISKQRMGKREPLQRCGVFAIVAYESRKRIPIRSAGLAEQPIKLLSGLAR